MRIVRLAIHEFKGIKEADFEPGHVMMLTGPKGSGKSSVLDAVIAAVNGGGSNLIRVGADKAIIFIDMAELELTRTITARGGNQPARIRIANGMSPTKPQQFLAELLGALAFNPLEFWRLKPVDQREYLLQMTPAILSEEEAAEACGGELPPIDYSGHGLDVAARLQKWFEDERTKAKVDRDRTEKAATVSAAAIPEGFGERLEEVGSPDAARGTWLVNRNAASTKLADIAAARRAVEQGRAKRAGLDEKLAGAEMVLKAATEVVDGAATALRDMTPLQDLEAEEDRLVDALTVVLAKIENAKAAKEKHDNAAKTKQEAEQRIEEIESLLTALPNADAEELAPETEARWRAVMEERETDLVALGSWVAHRANVEALAEAEAEVERLDKQVKYWLREAPARLLKQADLPIPGLSFDGGRVLIDGVDINERSDGEKLLTAVDIAKRLNAGAKLRVVFCDGLEQLDPVSQAEFIRMAEADPEYQYIMTCVSGREGLPGSVVMEGGRVKERRGEENKLRLVT